MTGMRHVVVCAHKFDVSEIHEHSLYALIYDDLYDKCSMISETSMHKNYPTQSTLKTNWRTNQIEKIAVPRARCQ